MMLDAQQTFDGIIARFAPSPAARDRILANHYYRFVSGRLAGVHEYMAMEKLYELASADRYDAIVLDTPPTAHALDFLAAPGRMSGLMDEGVLRWLVLPASAGGWRMIEMGSEVLAKVLQRMLGDRTIADIAEFFTAFQGLWEGFRDRSVRVQQMLREPATRFVLVATPAPQSRAEALQFLTVLADRRMPFSGFIVNRCATPAATPEAWPAPPAGVTGDWPALVGALEGLVRAHGTVVAEQEAAIARMQAEAPAGTRVWRLPELPGAVHDLAGLHALEPWLPTLDAVFA
jgi:anion-transporting  ArsA/GET3 family ATPase